MPLIDFHYLDPGTGADTPSAGYLDFSLLAREVVDGAFRTVRTFRVLLVEGRASVDLSTTSPSQCWQVTEGGQIAGRRTRWVAVTVAANFTALPDIDRATLQPMEAVPPSVADLLAEATAVLEAATARTVTATVDPADPDVILLDYPSFMLDPSDNLILSLTIGASA